MNIEKWSIAKRMYLPDWCFGPRWPLIITGSLAAGITEFRESDVALPDKWVLWELEVTIWPSTDVYADRLFQSAISMGPKVAASDAAFKAYETILFGSMYMSGGVKTINGPYVMRRIRMGFNAKGRKICTRVRNVAGVTTTYSIILVVSSLPKEVPDWLISGQADWRW